MSSSFQEWRHNMMQKRIERLELSARYDSDGINDGHDTERTIQRRLKWTEWQLERARRKL